MRILRRARKTCDEIVRTHEVKLRKNVDKLVFLYRSRKPEEVAKYCDDEFELFTMAIKYEKTRSVIFLKMMNNAQLNSFDVASFDKILDAIQAGRPFYPDLLKQVIEHNHEVWTSVVTKYYNMRFKELSGNEILQFAALVSKQRKGILSYGMCDNRFVQGLHDLMATFFCRTFKNLMPLLLEVLEKMKKDYLKERETICISYGPIDLFKFVNEVYDMSLGCADPIVQKGVLGLIFK
jgi:hypothetical protein